MDVKRNAQSARTRSLILGSLVLAMLGSHCQSAGAEVVFASDAPETSAVFVTDDTPSQPPHAPKSVSGTIVIVDDEPAPARKAATFVPPKTTQAQPMPSARPQGRGDLKVVNDPNQLSTKPTAARPMSTQQPLKPLDQPAVIHAAAVQTAGAIEPVASTAQRDQPGDIAAAVHDEPVLHAPQPSKPQPTTPQEQLIEAYKLSTTAKTSEEYTTIIDWCSEALRHELKGDQRRFASKLAAWSLNRRGQLRADAGEKEPANADFQAALEFNPRHWRALHNRGVSFAQDGAFAEAFDDFSTVIQINPKYAKAFANRATLYVQAKDLDSAIKDYQRAIELDDQFATAHVGLGRVYHMLGEWETALNHLSAAIEIEPNSPDIICSRGDLQADMGKYGDALGDYARTIELDPEFGHAYRNGAWLLATCPDEAFRDPENAVLGAQQALEYSYGERHVALDTLAAALASAGKFDEAVDTVQQAVDLAPENTKFTYLSRLQLYQENQPFRTEPIGDIAQATYEATDQ